MENNLNFNQANDAMVARYMNYRQILQFLRIRDVPEDTIHHLAILLHAGDMFHTDWMETAFLMGVRDRSALNKIKVTAEHTREIPLLVALKNYLAMGSFVQVIDALLMQQRYDILSDLEDYVREAVSNLPPFQNPHPDDLNLHEED